MFWCLEPVLLQNGLKCLRLERQTGVSILCSGTQIRSFTSGMVLQLFSTKHLNTSVNSHWHWTPLSRCLHQQGSGGVLEGPLFFQTQGGVQFNWSTSCQLSLETSSDVCRFCWTQLGPGSARSSEFIHDWTNTRSETILLHPSSILAVHTSKHSAHSAEGCWDFSVLFDIFSKYLTLFTHISP